MDLVEMIPPLLLGLAFLAVMAFLIYGAVLDGR